jgi:hypothetical protein
MRVVFGGGLGLRGGEAELVGALTEVLNRLGHSVLHWGPAGSDGELYHLNSQRISECDLMAAFVDNLTFELGADVQEAINAEKPVLCFTNGKVPVTSPVIVGAAQAMLVDLTHYTDFDDLADKLMSYLGFVSSRDLIPKVANA